MIDMTNAAAVEILLVEDNPGDARLTEEAFRDSRLLNNMHRVSDGVQASAYLRNVEVYYGGVPGNEYGAIWARFATRSRP